MQANKSKLIVAGLLAAQAAKALHLGGEEATNAPAALAQIRTESAVQAQLNVATEAQIQTRAADPDETDAERREREAEEKVAEIFEKILDGIEEKREEALEWLCDFGDELIDDVHDKADTLEGALSTLADNRGGDMESLRGTVQAKVASTLAEAKAAMFQLKAEAADAVTEKRKEVMYAIKDLKIEIGTTFKKDVKADKKAQIEALVSELESFINKTIRDYDEAVANQISKVGAATSAASAALATEAEDAQDAFTGASNPAENELDTFIDGKLEDLDEAYTAKNEAAMEVHNYLTDNFTRYFEELLAHILQGASEAERDVLIAEAINQRDNNEPFFLDQVADLNTKLSNAMTRKMAQVIKHINSVKGGKEIQHQHTEDGRIAEDLDGNPIILQFASTGYVSHVLAIHDGLFRDLMDIQDQQKVDNSAATAAAGEAEDIADNWLYDATHNELSILSDFLEKGFAFHVDTTDFVTHTANPYAPFSTGDYNELVDQINGFEQFFLYWKRDRERAIHTLASCKAQEKNAVTTDVFEIDIPALEQVADDLLIASSGAADSGRVEGETCLKAAKSKDTEDRESLEGMLDKHKAKIFREISFMVKKLYRATREEYKYTIRQDLEEVIEHFNDKLDEARDELEVIHEESYAEEVAKDATAKASFKSLWVNSQLGKFDDWDQEKSPETILRLEMFRDQIMDQKIATARAEVDAGLTKKERDIKAAYEAVKLKISKIDDHHFQYNVRTLLEDAKAEADRRCAHEEHGTNEIIDGIEEWVWDFVEESILRYNDKVKAERGALAEGLAAAADRFWEETGEHQDIHEQHQEHEKHQFEFFLNDCVKGLKHLFNRYGYISPQFAEKPHQHGTGAEHSHVPTEIDAAKLVSSLQVDPDAVHKETGLDTDDIHSWEGLNDDEEESDESRSSCYGSECENPLVIDHDHKEIQLDSLQDLAHIIDDEIIHRGQDHKHVEHKEVELIEYEPFIQDPEAIDENPVKVAPVHAPEYYESHGYEMPDRPVTHYDAIEVPSFGGYSKPEPHHDDGHGHSHAEPAYHEPEPEYHEPYYEEPARPDVHSEPSAAPQGDIWGSYLAKYSKPESKASYAKPAEAWKPQAYAPFDFGKYLQKGKDVAPAGYEEAPRKEYWWEAQPAAGGSQENWWDALTSATPEDGAAPAHYKPARQRYVPRTSYAKPWQPAKIDWRANLSNTYSWMK